VAFYGRAEAGRPTSFTPAKVKDNLGPLMVFQLRREAVAGKTAQDPALSNDALDQQRKAREQLYLNQMRLAEQAWQGRVEKKLDPAAGADKKQEPYADFIRRAYLDMKGTLPRPDVVEKFLKDPDPRKKAKLIDDLLQRVADKKDGKELRQKLLQAWKDYMDLEALESLPKNQPISPPDLPEEIRFYVKDGKLYMTVKTREGTTTVPVPTYQRPAQKPKVDPYPRDDLKIYPYPDQPGSKPAQGNPNALPMDSKADPRKYRGAGEELIVPILTDGRRDPKSAPAPADKLNRPKEQPHTPSDPAASKADPKEVTTTVYTLKHISAKQVTPLLQSLLSPGNGAANLAITYDLETNTIYLRGDRQMVNRALELLRKLDTPGKDPRP
jgi:hypothetical protein